MRDFLHLRSMKNLKLQVASLLVITAVAIDKFVDKLDVLTDKAVAAAQSNLVAFKEAELQKLRDAEREAWAKSRTLANKTNEARAAAGRLATANQLIDYDLRCLTLADLTQSKTAAAVLAARSTEA